MQRTSPPQALAYFRGMPQSIVLGIAACSLVPLQTSVAQEGERPLTSVMDNIRQNEALYENMEVIWRLSYTTEQRTRLPPGFSHYSVYKKQGRYVRQDGMYYLDYARHWKSTSGREGDYSLLMAFDGEVTRSLEDRPGKIANIVQGLRGADQTFLPHARGLKDLNVPLSVWLQGPEAVAAYPGGKGRKSDKLYDREITYVGRDVVNDLDCESIALTAFPRGRKNGPPPISRTQLWFAVDRNYLPIQSTHFSLGVSAELPRSECHVGDLREISPGVWFPFATTWTGYDRRSLEEDGKHVVSWREDVTIEKAVLDPAYDRRFFQNIEFPDGTPVYEITDGEM